MKLKALPFVLALLLTPALFAQDYEIRITRALKAGDQLKLSATGKMSQATTTVLNDAAPQEQKQDVSVQFDGTEKVLAVDASGRESKAELTVEKFTATVGGATQDVAPKGAVISCSVDGGKPSFQIDGKDADAQTMQALGMVVQLSNGGPTDDDIFGTKDKKKKGDSWDINVDLAKKNLADMAGGAEVTDMKGKTTVDDVTADGLKLTASVSGKVKPPLPPTITIDDSAFTATFGGIFPKDVKAFPPTETEEMHISFSAHAEGPNGKVVIKSTITQSQTRNATMVK